MSCLRTVNTGTIKRRLLPKAHRKCFLKWQAASFFPHISFEVQPRTPVERKSARFTSMLHNFRSICRLKKKDTTHTDAVHFITSVTAAVNKLQPNLCMKCVCTRVCVRERDRCWYSNGDKSEHTWPSRWEAEVTWTYCSLTSWVDQNSSAQQQNPPEMSLI